MCLPRTAEIMRPGEIHFLTTMSHFGAIFSEVTLMLHASDELHAPSLNFVDLVVIPLKVKSVDKKNPQKCILCKDTHVKGEAHFLLSCSLDKSCYSCISMLKINWVYHLLQHYCFAKEC